jgi:peptide subunit release factor 1 (eRF1)
MAQCWAHNPEDRPEIADVVKTLERLYEEERNLPSKTLRQRGVDDASQTVRSTLSSKPPPL